MEKNIYVQTARDLGCVLADNKQKYYVGNGMNPIELHVLEYAVWRAASNMPSIDMWRKKMAEKLKPKTKVTIEQIEKRLLKLKVLHDLQFTSIQDDELVKFFVIRNGEAVGQVGKQWGIGSKNLKDQFAMPSELMYKVWIEASSYCSLLEVVLNIAELENLTAEDSLSKVCNIARQLVQSGLWTIEYVDGGVK